MCPVWDLICSNYYYCPSYGTLSCWSLDWFGMLLVHLHKSTGPESFEVGPGEWASDLFVCLPVPKMLDFLWYDLFFPLWVCSEVGIPSTTLELGNFGRYRLETAFRCYFRAESVLPGHVALMLFVRTSSGSTHWKHFIYSTCFEVRRLIIASKKISTSTGLVEPVCQTLGYSDWMIDISIFKRKEKCYWSWQDVEKSMSHCFQ